MVVLLAIAVTILFCALCLFMYLAHINNGKVLKLNEELRQKDAVLADAKKEIDNLQKILPVTPTTPFLQKEIEHLNAVLHEKDDDVLNLKNTLRERDTEVSRLRIILRDKDNDVLRQRDNEVLNLKNTLREKEKEILMLRKIIGEQDNQICRLKSQSTLQQKVSEAPKETPTFTNTVNEVKTPYGTTFQPSPPTAPLPKRFVTVIFEEKSNVSYDYFVENNRELHVNDFVEVPFVNKYSGEKIFKIAIVKYVSAPGEKSCRATDTVIRKVPYPPPHSPLPPIEPTSQPKTPPTQSAVSSQPPPVSSKRFIQVIFRKRGKKRYDYLLGDNKNINVGDFVVVHVNINGKTTWKIAKVVYISSPNEVSLHAKSALIKKADYDKW